MSIGIEDASSARRAPDACGFARDAGDRFSGGAQMKRQHRETITWRRTALPGLAGALTLIGGAHAAGLWYARSGATADERRVAMPGDEIVSNPKTGYTLAITIRAAAPQIWPWLVQVGQGRAGFYTYEWVENLLGAKIHNADAVVPGLQNLQVSDTIRLTPDPYLGQPGQFMTVARLEPERALVLKQTLPNGTAATWALVLRERNDHTTRLLSRRRGVRPTMFDRIMWPGYVFMDRGVLRGIRKRVEATASRD
jgi:hypothetical protein